MTPAHGKEYPVILGQEPSGGPPIDPPRAARREEEQAGREHVSELKRLNRIFEPMWAERDPMLPMWSDCCSLVLPHRWRYGGTSDPSHVYTNRSKIIDDTATRALDVAVSGMIAGMASPAREWFELTVPDLDIAEDDDVQEWLQQLRNAVLGVYERSNVYQQLSVLFTDENLVGTGAVAVFEDHDRYIRLQSFPVGGYSFSQDWFGNPNGFCREFVMTAEQVAREFGMDNVSEDTRKAVERGAHNVRVIVRHLIWPEPMKVMTIDGDDAVNMPYAEAYWESRSVVAGGMDPGSPRWALGANGRGEGKVLRRSGYHEFPVIIGRWARDNTSLWATNWPTATALGNIRELQVWRRMSSNAGAKMIDPPLNVDASLLGFPVSLQAASKTYVNGLTTSGNPGVRPTHEVRWAIREAHEYIMDLRNSIREAYKVPVFQALTEREGVQPLQNEETRARIQERGELIGPIQEAHSDQVFDPLIERTLGVIMRRMEMAWESDDRAAQLVPPPPERLREGRGAALRPVYVGEVARAQKLQALAPIERLVQFTAGYAQAIDPSVIDVLDGDRIIEAHAEVLGAPLTILRKDEEVADMRAERRRMQAAAQAAEAAPKIASAAKDFSQVAGAAGPVPSQPALQSPGGAI